MLFSGKKAAGINTNKCLYFTIAKCCYLLDYFYVFLIIFVFLLVLFLF